MKSDVRSRDEILRAVARELPDPIFVLDEDGRYVEVIGGTSRDKYDDPGGLVGKSLTEVMSKQLAGEFLHWIQEALAAGRTITREYALASDEVENPDGERGPGGTQWFEASVVPLRIRHEGRRLVAWIAYNATERHQMLRRLEQQNELVRIQKEELENLALTDHLTSLANRRHFLSIFQHEFRKVSTGRSSCLSLIILDLDHFKRVNDRRGHAAGDAVLQAVAELLRTGVRSSDLVARIGGEEFAVLLPNTTLEDASDLAGKLITRIEEASIEIRTGSIRITASLGLAAYQEEDEDYFELMKRADDALYRAKAEGRNRWCKSA